MRVNSASSSLSSTSSQRRQGLDAGHAPRSFDHREKRDADIGALGELLLGVSERLA
jgi:hypothetical protein